MSPRSIFFASSTSCAAGLAQEELQRVGRRLLRRDGGDDGRRLLGLGLLDELDPAPVELAVERVLLERVELVRLDDLAQLGRLQRPGLLRRVQQLLELVVSEELVDVDCGHCGGALAPSTATISPPTPDVQSRTAVASVAMLPMRC